ncbi:MAG: type II toxin-antitoxin system VapB family antitoxin, partial [Steroidobacteraceae bacterium]|nr:type II toxin-antitoxin system VapB family antitoxin [Steroidobacteraceae bacterium]
MFPARCHSGATQLCGSCHKLTRCVTPLEHACGASAYPGADRSSPRRLHDMHNRRRIMHMRTTLILDEELLADARRLSGLKEKTAVVHAGLRALISRESARRLAALGGTER